MDAETRTRIFEPFFTTKEKGKGTGLGLATVFGVVQQSRGAISVESDLGKGTRFELYFPKASSKARARSAPPLLAFSKRDPGSVTILVVDDEHDVRRAMVDTLRSEGCAVLEASGAREAVSSRNSIRPRSISWSPTS